MTAIKVGISSCLLGQNVRHDGGHKKNSFVVNTLADYFEFQPFCPEVAAGLGTPRPTIRLVSGPNGIRLQGTKDPEFDVSDSILSVSKRQLQTCTDLSGYILKKDSPSCGMERVRVYNAKGHADRTGTGLFASRLLEMYPQLPVEEEGRLMDPVLRENFIERVFVYKRWQQLMQTGLSVNSLIEFHTEHKFTLMAHDERRYRELGPLVAKANARTIDSVAARYVEVMMQALKVPATRKRHTNVMMHAAGHLKKTLSSDEKSEFSGLLDRYRRGRIPLVVPITMLKHFLRRTPQGYVNNQRYLDPYPEDLMLRNTL